MADSKNHEILRRCRELAVRSVGRTATNPNVGAVVWDHASSRILGEGWHQAYGEAHAEVNALAQALHRGPVKGKTISVSLEPCNHTGKTPACTSAIVNHELGEVLIDQVDPNPRMSGRSVDLLREAGLIVPPPADTEDGRAILQSFHIGIRRQRPFIRLKVAMSRDGFMGKIGERVKISNAISDRWVHRIRQETQAIMAGTQTILNDDPALTSRYGNQHHPIRVIPDRRGVLPHTLNVFNPVGKVIVCTTNISVDYPAQILQVDPHDLDATFQLLYQKCQISSILVEGGSKLFASILKANLWDELILIENTDLELKNGVQAPKFPTQILRHKIKFGTDTIKFIINPASR